MMNIRKHAHETLGDVSDASKKVVGATEWATVALVAVAGVSLLALLLAVVAINTGDQT
jgi:hypothetical protein